MTKRAMTITEGKRFNYAVWAFLFAVWLFSWFMLDDAGKATLWFTVRSFVGF